MKLIFLILLVWIGSYLALQILRIVTAILKSWRILPIYYNYCPFCIGTIITWLVGIIYKWPFYTVTLFMGITIFDFAVRLKAYLKSKNNKYADYVKQIFSFVCVVIILIILTLRGIL